MFTMWTMLFLWCFVMLASHVFCFGQDIFLVCPGNSCNCSHDSQSGIAAVCRVNDLRDLEENIAIPDKIHSLDISNNGMTTVQDSVFVNFTNLVHLSLARNGISTISSRAFDGLVKLKTLNLKENNVEIWDLELTIQLPSLQKMDVTANRNWKTPKNILKLKSLQELVGLYLNDNCQNCRLLKRNEMIKAQALEVTAMNNEGFTIQQDCLEETFSLNSSYSFLMTNSFFPTCTLEDKDCQKSLGFTKQTNRCLQIGKSLLIAAFPIGIIAVMLNVFVVMETLSSKRLRQQPYLILVSFLAIADTLEGVYIIVIASVYQAVPPVELETKRKNFCDYIGFASVFANTMTMNISLLLTIERYLATIFWSRPNMKMQIKHVLLAPLISIAICLVLSIWGLFNENFTDGGLAGYVCYPIPDFKDKTYSAYSIFVTTAAELIYLIIFGMYLHIFIVARNSGRQLGIAREAKLAKRIGAVVFTNIVCNFLPFTLFVVVISTDPFVGSSAEVSVGTVVGCLIILPGINSIMNSILYAYSNEKLRRHFEKRIHSITETVNSAIQERPVNPSVVLLRVRNITSAMVPEQNNF